MSCPHDSFRCDLGTTCPACVEDRETNAARMTAHRRICTKPDCWWCSEGVAPPRSMRLDGTPHTA